MRSVLLTIMAMAVMVIAPPAYASCAPPPDLETVFSNAELVFVGIVTGVSNNGRTAQVEVEQVWKGEEQPFNVVVNGGPRDPDLFTSVDRTFEPGIYLFFPTNTGPPFEDNVCTLTQRFNESLDVINPFGEEPADDGLDAGGGAVFESASETTAGTYAAEALERIAGTELDDDPVGVEPVDDGLDAGGGAVFESASETTAGTYAAEALERIAGTEPDDDRADTDQAQLLIFAASVVAAIGAGLIALRARRNR